MNRRAVPEPLVEVLEAGLDGSVELADRVELLEVRDDLVVLVVGQRDGLRDRLEPLGVLDVHPLRAARGRRSGGGRPRRTASARSAPRPGRRRRGIGKFGRAKRGAAPTAVSRFWTSARWSISCALISRSVARQRWTAASVSGVRPSSTRLLERERREQVLEHDEVLELGRLAERVDQRLAVLEAPRVSVSGPPPDGQDVGQRTVRAGRDVLEHRAPLRVVSGCRPERPQPRDWPRWTDRHSGIGEVERETGFEPATFCLGSRHSAS